MENGNVPKLTYAMTPTFATVSSTANFKLAVTNPSQFPVTMKRQADQISITGWSSLTASVGQISPAPPPDSAWLIAVVNNSFIKIGVTENTVIGPGDSVEFRINNVAIDANVGQGSLSILEAIGGNAKPPDIPIGKLGAELQIFAYANPVTIGLDQKTQLNWTIVKGRYVTIAPLHDGERFERTKSPNEPESFAIDSAIFQDQRQTTFTLTVFEDQSKFVSTPLTVNLSPPVITMFSNTPPAPISIDGTMSLAWSTVYATQATLSSSTGTIGVPLAGTKSYTSSNLKKLVTNNQSQLVFRLAAQGFLNPAGSELVVPLQPVTIDWFRFADLTHKSFTQGVSNWTSVSLPSASGPPPYTLTAQGPFGPVQQSLGGNGIEVLVLNADPSDIAAGGSSTLDFELQQASSAVLDPGNLPLTFDGKGIGHTVVSPASTTTYTLTAIDAAGNRASSPITVTVTAKTGRLTTKRKKPATKKRRTTKGAKR